METKPDQPQANEKAPASFWVKLTFVYLLIPLVLWLCAGTLRWWQGWVFTLLILAVGIGGRAWAEMRHPGLMTERTKPYSREDVKPWDRVLSPLMSLTVGFPLMIVAGLDHRFGWTAQFPPWLNILGLLVIGIGYGFAGWALVENRFFSGVVRIQNERGHTVCDSGPYRVVRHPGYAGNVWALAGIVLGLNSLWTIIPALVALAVTVTRTALEDRTLQAELPGYREYTQRTKYRLLPGIW